MPEFVRLFVALIIIHDFDEYTILACYINYLIILLGSVQKEANTQELRVTSLVYRIKAWVSHQVFKSMRQNSHGSSWVARAFVGLRWGDIQGFKNHRSKWALLPEKTKQNKTKHKQKNWITIKKIKKKEMDLSCCCWSLNVAKTMGLPWSSCLGTSPGAHPLGHIRVKQATQTLTTLTKNVLCLKLVYSPR